MSANMVHAFDLNEDLIAYSRAYDPSNSLVIRRKWAIYGFEEKEEKKNQTVPNNIFYLSNKGVFGISEQENLKNFYSMLWHAIYTIFEETRSSVHFWNDINIQKMPSYMLDSFEISNLEGVMQRERRYGRFVVISSSTSLQENDDITDKYIKLVKLRDENQRGDPINFQLILTYQEAIHLAFYMSERFNYPSCTLDQKYNYANDYFF